MNNFGHILCLLKVLKLSNDNKKLENISGIILKTIINNKQVHDAHKMLSKINLNAIMLSQVQIIYMFLC